MSNFGIDGLSSGLDTTGIINQLMQLERQPAVRLENRTAQNKQAITALGTLNLALATVNAAAKSLQDATKSFVPRIATSSGTHVTATASATAQVGSTSFTVDKVATRHAVVSDGVAASRDAVVNSSGGDVNLSITIGATTHDIPVADGTTLRQLSEQINAVAGLGVSASLVDTGNGIKLQLAGATSGAAGVFSVDLTELDAAALGGQLGTKDLTTGQDATITVGTGAGKYAVTSPTNTFNDLIAGLSFTVTAASADQVTVGVQEDQAALTTKVKTLVDAVNSAITEMDRQLKSGLNGATAGPLAGNSTLRSLRDQLINSVTFPVDGADLKSGGLVGISPTRAGMLEFDATKFSAALAKDPAAVQALFRSGDPTKPGIAERTLKQVESATKSGTGTIATIIKSRETQNKTFASMIEGIDRRVALRRATMMRQFANLEIVMGQMQGQQSWMASQIGAMNANRG